MVNTFITMHLTLNGSHPLWNILSLGYGKYPCQNTLDPSCFHQNPGMVSTFIEIHLAHKNILNTSFQTQTKISYIAFKITKCLFHYNPMSLPMISHKLAYNPHFLSNIRSYTYHIAYMRLPTTF
jgi:hypothetical protein